MVLLRKAMEALGGILSGIISLEEVIGFEGL